MHRGGDSNHNELANSRPRERLHCRLIQSPTRRRFNLLRALTIGPRFHDVRNMLGSDVTQGIGILRQGISQKKAPLVAGPSKRALLALNRTINVLCSSRLRLPDEP